MPKPSRNEIVNGQYFRWVLRIRQGVYFADGRSNSPSLGRHSLEARNRVEALAALRELDLHMAVKHGLANPALISTRSVELLTLTEGRRVYELHVQRPAVVKGPKPSTAKR